MNIHQTDLSACTGPLIEQKFDTGWQGRLMKHVDANVSLPFHENEIQN